MKKIVIIILILLQVNLQNLFADATPAFPTFFDYNLIEEPGLELNGPFKRTFSTEFSLGRSYYETIENFILGRDI